jgi:hypothetical protein
MSGESVAAIAKDMRARQHFQGLAGFAAIRCETAVPHPMEAAVKLPWPFAELSAARLHSTVAKQRATI